LEAEVLLRWILLGLSAVLLCGIWWWGARRSRQLPKNTEWREPAAGLSAGHERVDEPPPRTPADSRDWGVPPFEPLSIRTADFDEIQPLDSPMSAAADPLDVTLNMEAVEQHEAAAERAMSATHAVLSEPTLGDDVEIAPAARHEPPPPTPPPSPAETQRIVTVRVSAAGDSRWPGAELLAALETHGMEFGRYKVFHLKHSDGRTLFCAASLVEPGTFDPARMPQEEFRGLTLFAVLPGPADVLQTIDVLIATAFELADTLQGNVQDSNGAPMTPQRAEALREDVAQFRTAGNGARQAE
jgi:cell division protein ZipA